jgi:hypothetical protein
VITAMVFFIILIILNGPIVLPFPLAIWNQLLITLFPSLSSTICLAASCFPGSFQSFAIFFSFSSLLEIPGPPHDHTVCFSFETSGPFVGLSGHIFVFSSALVGWLVG